MVAAYREKYQAAFEQAGLTLPEDICEGCARGLWKKPVVGESIKI